VRDPRAGRVGGGCRNEEQGDDEDRDDSHTGRHVELAIAAIPLSRIALMKSRFPSIAAKEKK
jgi:hypothetical protein